MNTEKAERKRKTSQSLVPSAHPVFLILVIVDFYCEDYKSWIFDARMSEEARICVFITHRKPEDDIQGFPNSITQSNKNLNN